MVRISFAALPAYGHVLPLVPLAEACRAAGADVRMASGRPFGDRIGIPWQPGIRDGVTLDGLTATVMSTYPEVRVDVPARWPVAFFGWANAAAVIPALRDSWREWRPDLVVYESTNAGAAVVADELGIRRLSFTLGNWSPSIAALTRLARHALDPQPPRAPWEWVAADLEAHPETLDVDSIDSFPHRWRNRGTPVARSTIDLRPQSTRIAGQDGSDLPPLGRDRPLVYVTLGTVASRRTEVLRAAIEGAASLDVQVLAATGPETDPRDLGAVPSNVAVRTWVDQEAVLARAAIAVHHGGAGTLCACGAAAVPQVILPQMADQFLNAASIDEHGVGRSLVGEAATPSAIAAAIAALLDDPAVRRDAEALRREIAGMPSPEQVAERLLAA